MDYTLKMIPIYSVVLLFITFLSISFYYDSFGIDISNYIDLSELFLLALPFFKYIAIAVGLALSPFLLMAIFAFFMYMLKPQDAVIKEVIAEKLKETTEAARDLPTKEALYEKMKIEMGFHLFSEISNVYQMARSRTFNKAFKFEVFRILFVCAVMGYFLFGIIGLIIEAFSKIKKHHVDFITDPLQQIFILLAFTIMAVYMFCQLFAAKFLWQSFFRHLFTEKGLPVLFMVLYLLTTLLYQKAGIDKLKYTQLTERYVVYLKGDTVRTSPKTYHFIGRTKNHLFLLLNQKQVKIVNIAEADSIVQLLDTIAPILKKSVKPKT